MAATEFKPRRGTQTQMDSFTGAQDEFTITTDNGRIQIHDGVTAAGAFIFPNIADIQKAATTYATAGGTANALTLTLAPALAAYAAGGPVRFKAASNNTGSATLNVSGLGAKTFKKLRAGTLGDLVADDIVAGAIYEAVYDGTNFQLQSDAIGDSSFLAVQVFTANGTYNPTAGANSAIMIVQGGGGGGAGAPSSTDFAGGGGGGGGFAIERVSLSGITSETVTRGAGGTGGSASGPSGQGGAGGTTSIGSILSATGGGGAAANQGLGGAGGVGSGGDLNGSGSGGGHGGGGGYGGASFFGGGARNPVGSSPANGVAGQVYGGGGSGAATNSGDSGYTGGAGAIGCAIILEFA